MFEDHLLRIMTINSGSSSIKFSLYQMSLAEALILSGRIERIGVTPCFFYVKNADGLTLVERQLDLLDHDSAFKMLFDWLQKYTPDQNLDAVGHRVVHGGNQFRQPHLVTLDLIRILKDLFSVDPDHLPHELKAIEVVNQLYPKLRQVVCFDTAFHRHMPKVAQLYAIPKYLRDEGIIRYGFHGLSYEFIMQELTKEAGAKVANGRIIIAHLGNGASMVAIHHTKGVDTTMGFSPTGGLVMSTRSGDLDPGIILYLLQKKGLTPSQVNDMVNLKAGLLGVSGISSDMKDLLYKKEENPQAAEAVDLFCYQARKFLGALTAVLGGLDTLIFTGGIGENAPSIRRQVCKGLGFLGIHIDPNRNDANASIISDKKSSITVRVMKTNEELMIARHAHKLLKK
ncbi:MAG: acetate/propionate family kinase [Syntrophaceae bacterium]|nr:acetate/propionate family kinase [Syntrophaceae bacterium]